MSYNSRYSIQQDTYPREEEMVVLGYRCNCYHIPVFSVQQDTYPREEGMAVLVVVVALNKSIIYSTRHIP